MKLLFLISFIAAAALLAVLKFTTNTDSQQGVVQLIWVTDDNPARKEQIELFRQWHLQKYGKAVDIRIDPSNGGSNKIIIQSIAGAGPDLFDFYGRVELERYVQSGIILDVTDAAKQNNFSAETVWPAIQPSFTLNGRQYGFPDNANANVLLYHKDLFDQAGVPYPKPDWTWQDFEYAAKRLTRKRPDGLRQFALLSVDPLEMIYQKGVRMYSADGTKCTLDTPKAVEALQFYRNLREKLHVMPTPSDVASQSFSGGWGKGNLNLFAAKFTAMTIGGRWWYIQYAKNTQQALDRGEKPPFDLGVAEVPIFKQHYGMATARLTGINRNSPHAQQALHFLEFLATESFNRQVNRRFDALAPVAKYAEGFPASAGSTPPAGLASANDPLWVKVMNYSHEVERSPFIPPYRTDALWGENIQLMDAGDSTPAETLHTFARLVNEEITRNISSDPKLHALYLQLQQQEAGR